MDFEKFEFEKGTAFILSGSMEVGRFDRFLHEARAALSPESPFLLCDLENVDFLDSSGISALIELFKITKLSGGELVLAGVRDYPLQILKTVRLDQYIKFFETRQEGVKYLLSSNGSSPPTNPQTTEESSAQTS